MTLIEFFDRDAIENIGSSLTYDPERIIFIGNDLQKMQAGAERYRKNSFIGPETEIEYSVVGINNMTRAVDVLSEAVEKYGDCTIDLTGGSDVLLVAAGIVFERYKSKGLRIRRINISKGSAYDCDPDGNPGGGKKLPAISVEENVRIYGGEIIWDSARDGATHTWDMNEEFCEDIRTMWDICRADVKKWNSFVSDLSGFVARSSGGDCLKIRFTELSPDYGKVDEFERLLDRLAAAGLITGYSVDGGEFVFRFRNAQIGRCLSSAGRVLEMRIYLAALEVAETDGSYTYDDALTGVTVDWDGITGFSGEQNGVENEIDVVMTRGMVPFFVSCKNGNVDVNEIYKLHTVSTRFGGKYAKKILILACPDQNQEANGSYFKTLAKELDVRVVDSFEEKYITELDDEELRECVRSFKTADNKQ